MKKDKIIINITIGIMFFLLVMTISMQFKVVQKSEETDIDTMQETELKSQLASWKAKYEETKEKYDEIVETLETYKMENTSDSQTGELLEKELKKLETFLGKTDVEGEGITITLSEKKQNELTEDEEVTPITAEDFILIVNSLKDAGAEAISINDERIVNITDIADVGDAIKINSKYLRTGIYTIKAIGNSSYLENCILGKGGYAEQLNITGINVKTEKERKIRISKYAGNFEMKYIKESE